MLFLLDKSAHEIARREPEARRVFETLAATGLLATCAMVALEILYSARSRSEYRQLRTYLRDTCEWLETDESIMLDALRLQERMADAAMHRKPLPDLIISAVAIHHNAVLVHHDRDFDHISQHADDLRTRWIIPAKR